MISQVEKPQSLLMVGNFLSASGLTRQVCEDLAQQLEQAGFLVLRTSTKMGKTARLLDMVSTVWRKRNRFELAQVDVFSGRSFLWAESVCWALRKCSKPYVLTLHGGGLPKFAKSHPERVQRLLQSAARVTTPSGFLRDALCEYRSDLLVIPNPLDVSQFKYRLRNKAHPRLVWIRSFADIYNPTLAPQVVSQLMPRFPDVSLTMVGPDKDGSQQRTADVAKELGVLDRIKFPGGVPKEQIPEWLDDADVFINTTNVDNTPLSVLEAMAAGLCIVTTDVGGIPYLVDDARNGLTVPPDDVTQMTAAIARVLEDEQLASNLSQEGRRHAEQFDWPVILPKWVELLGEVNSAAGAAAS